MLAILFIVLLIRTILDMKIVICPLVQIKVPVRIFSLSLQFKNNQAKMKDKVWQERKKEEERS